MVVFKLLSAINEKRFPDALTEDTFVERNL
jgi:hypothetical protein